jgi:hypothetical protein
MTFAQFRGCGRGSVTADGGTHNSRALTGSFIQAGFVIEAAFFIQEGVTLSDPSQFRKGAPWVA